VEAVTDLTLDELAEAIARASHETYERYAIMHGWQTQESTRGRGCGARRNQGGAAVSEAPALPGFDAIGPWHQTGHMAFVCVGDGSGWPGCGALVLDLRLHDDWHRRQAGLPLIRSFNDFWPSNDEEGPRPAAQ
jgi:hypothetical protein